MVTRVPVPNDDLDNACLSGSSLRRVGVVRSSAPGQARSVSADPFGLPPWETPEDPDPDPRTVEGLIELLDAQANLLVAVATGGPRIDVVNGKYKRRRRTLNAAVGERGLPPPFPYEDLWAWHGHWSQHLPNYASRRTHIRELAAPVRAALETALGGMQVVDPAATTAPSWAALDARLTGVVTELAAASTLDDLQDVGRRCREVLIDAAKLLADPALIPPGADAPKAGDAKAWLELFLTAQAAGRSRRELRGFVPVAWDLAQKVTHGDVDRIDAYAAAQATVLIVRVLQQLAP